MKRNDFEQDDYLRAQADFEQQLRRSDPFIGDDLIQDQAQRQTRLQFYQNMRAKLFELAGNRTYTRNSFVLDCRNLWNDYIENHYSDGEQALNVFRQQLMATGLLEGQAREEAMKLNFHFNDLMAEKEQRRINERWQALENALNEILKNCKDRQTALGIYNVLGGPRTEEKLNLFVRDLVSAGQLPIEWLPGRKLGSILSKLLEPLRQVKMIDPRTENKS